MDQEAIVQTPAKRPLRIAMVCDIIPGQAGGSYISAVRFATLLRKRGHHVILIGSKDARQAAVPDYNGIPVYQFFALPTPGSHRYYFQSFPTRRQLRDVFVKEQIEIVHIMFPSYSCAVAKRVAKELHLPVVAHIHTQPENIFIFLPKFLQRKFVYNRLLRYLVGFVRGSRQIICPSELGKNIYQSIDPLLPITVISNGIDLREFHLVDTTAFRAKLGHKADKEQLLFIGRLAADKDPFTLLRAVPMLMKARPIHLNIIGTGPLLSACQALVKTLGVEDSVTFWGKVSDADLLAALSLCRLFILPSLVELEGMVVLEAMSCGKPILIADAPMSASRYLVRDNGLLFAQGDPADLAKKALEILTDNTIHDRMSQQSTLNVAGYEINQSVLKLENIYYSVL